MIFDGGVKAPHRLQTFKIKAGRSEEPGSVTLVCTESGVLSVCQVPYKDGSDLWPVVCLCMKSVRAAAEAKDMRDGDGCSEDSDHEKVLEEIGKVCPRVSREKCQQDVLMPGSRRGSWE